MKMTREEALREALDITPIGAEVIACVGKPTCLLQDAEADAAQAAGCPLCQRFIIQPDGSAKAAPSAKAN